MYTEGKGIIDRLQFLSELSSQLKDYKTVKTNKKVEYYNIPAAFDIETSSFYEGANKRAIMYIWQFGINNLVTTGRTWEEFIQTVNIVKYMLDLSDTKRLLVYVHNLPYEFQFMRKRLEWSEVFMLDERKPVTARTGGLEFRCSMKLAGGKSLDNVAKDLQKYKTSKMVGDLDYSQLRTPKTPLDGKELKYCENDIRVILHYIQEKIEQDGDVTRIPLTNTGYVREYCRKQCYKRWKPYRQIITHLTMTPDEYIQLKGGFMGGHTHANAHHVNKVLHNLRSYDFVSSYPAVMVLDKFPMSEAHHVTHEMSRDEFKDHLEYHCCLFDLELWGVTPGLHQEHPISYSKCRECYNYTLDNGRIVVAEHLKITVTEEDFMVYNEFYNWESYSISNFTYYEKNYLPTVFVKAILGLYEKKTVLKDVEGEEVNYMISKNMMNAAYGMTVTDPVRDEITYQNGVYSKTSPDLESAIDRYNKNIRRFLYYPWGVWVTAHARGNLFSGIIACGDDYVYADTDSIKCRHPEHHANYFAAYNDDIERRIQAAAAFHNIDPKCFSPPNKNGVAKTIGIWEDEGAIDEFKTLGAKRYLVRRGDKWTLTLAGANKVKAMQALIDSGDPFKTFSDKWKIGPEHSGRLTLTYFDDPIEGTVLDCNGVPYHYREESCIHMEQSVYSLSMSRDFVKFLQGYIDISE